MLRSSILFASCVLAAVNAYAQTIVPAEREPVYTKDDIFDKLTPLAQPKPVENEQPAPAQSAPESAPIELEQAEQYIEEEAQPPALETTTPQLPTLPTPTPTPTPTPKAEEPEVRETPPALAPLSPKLKAMLQPMPQGEGQPPRPIAHAPGAMTSLSAEELRTLIGHVAKQFNAELGQLKHGERWQTYLQLEQLSTACYVGADVEQVDKLPTIGLRFATLAGDPAYKALTKRNDFLTLNLALGEFLSLDDQRGARQHLLGSVQTLDQSLAPVGTGGQWSGYFELAALRRLGASPQPVSERDLVQLQLILARFEQAATDEKFSAVAKLAGFTETQSAIRGILGVSQRPTPLEVADALPEQPVGGEVTISDDGSTPLTQASATVERLPVAASGLQLISLGGKAFLKKHNDASWKQIGKTSAVTGDAIAARDETAQLVLGQGYGLQLSAQTTMTVAQRAIDDASVIELNLTQGSVKAIANNRGDAEQVLYMASGDYQLSVSGDDFAVEFRIDKKDGRVVAVVHAGQAAVENSATGDTAVVRAGREAVLLSSGIALRAAPKRTADWWQAAADQPRSARRNGGGFSE